MCKNPEKFIKKSRHVATSISMVCYILGKITDLICTCTLEWLETIASGRLWSGLEELGPRWCLQNLQVETPTSNRSNVKQGRQPPRSSKNCMCGFRKKCTAPIGDKSIQAARKLSDSEAPPPNEPKPRNLLRYFEHFKAGIPTRNPGSRLRRL
jgi:hypothetical protein